MFFSFGALIWFHCWRIKTDIRFPYDCSMVKTLIFSIACLLLKNHETIFQISNHHLLLFIHFIFVVIVNMVSYNKYINWFYFIKLMCCFKNVKKKLQNGLPFRKIISICDLPANSDSNRYTFKMVNFVFLFVCFLMLFFYTYR